MFGGAIPGGKIRGGTLTGGVEIPPGIDNIFHFEMELKIFFILIIFFIKIFLK